MKRIPDELTNEYLEKIPKMYEKEVLDVILSKDTNKEEAVNAAMEFYTRKNGGHAPSIIRWVDNPVTLKEEYKGQEVQIFTTYFNINWVYFFFTYINHLSENKEHVDPAVIEEYNETKNDSILAFEIFKNCFGVSELEGYNESAGKELKYNEIILVEKPERVKIENEKLHSLTGPAFEYVDGPTFYYIEGVNMPEELWASIVKTALQDDHSPLYEDLTPVQRVEAIERLDAIEAKNDKNIKLLSTEDILGIDNSEQKSKALRFIGFNGILKNAKVLNEEDVLTHKGEKYRYQLLSFDLGLEHDGIDSRFVRVACWSTGREYILQVDPRDSQCETAMGAVAWTCKKPDGSRCSEEEYRTLEFQT